MRLGILGGTFNPIHYGHLRAAEEIREGLNLAKIIFIPSAYPPHKKEEVINPLKRFSMVNLAIKENPFFSVSDIELVREGKSYTIETIKYLIRKYDKKMEIFFILGIDAFLEIEAWKDYRTLFSITNFIVISRPGYEQRTMDNPFPPGVSHEFFYDPKKKRYFRKDGFDTYFQEITLLDISSRKIRRYVREGKSIKYLLPENVMEYIRTHKLYR